MDVVPAMLSVEDSANSARRTPGFFECFPPPKPDGPKTLVGKLKTHVLHEDWFTWTKLRRVEFIKTEVLLGITICFAQVPESVAFAFMAHIKPPVALHAAWIVGLICTLLGGRSGMVNGAEGAFAAIISTLVTEPEVKGQNGEGIELLFPSVMTAGAFMLLIWAVGGDRCARPAIERAHQGTRGWCKALGATRYGWAQRGSVQRGTALRATAQRGACCHVNYQWPRHARQSAACERRLGPTWTAPHAS